VLQNRTFLFATNRLILSPENNEQLQRIESHRLERCNGPTLKRIVHIRPRVTWGLLKNVQSSKIALALSGGDRLKIDKSVAFSIFISEYFIDIDVTPSAMLIVIFPAIGLCSL